MSEWSAKTCFGCELFPLEKIPGSSPGEARDLLGLIYIGQDGGIGGGSHRSYLDSFR